MSRCIVELFNYIRIFDQIFIIRLIIFEKTVETRCKIQPPAEVLFSRTNARCKIQPPAGEKSVSRAPAVCSAPKRRFSAPRFSAPVGDALTKDAGAGGWVCSLGLLVRDRLIRVSGCLMGS
jgi:hypothetical protein